MPKPQLMSMSTFIITCKISNVQENRSRSILKNLGFKLYTKVSFTTSTTILIQRLNAKLDSEWDFVVWGKENNKHGGNKKKEEKERPRVVV